ncbi:MAG: hypothetical protein LBV44_10050 [Methylobacillus sp.]|jgi:probable HAF family extracellular repeat protein|nr:hypothetical protein [Methylobacillus sp.]
MAASGGGDIAGCSSFFKEHICHAEKTFANIIAIGALADLSVQHEVTSDSKSKGERDMKTSLALPFTRHSKLPNHVSFLFAFFITLMVAWVGDAWGDDDEAKSDLVIVEIGNLGGYSSRVNAVSADGRTLVGRSEIEQSTALSHHAFLWTADGRMQDLGTLEATSKYGRKYHMISAATGVSADGSVVVGFSNHVTYAPEYIGLRAFRWTPDGGMIDLGALGGADSKATAVSANGKVVVGWAYTQPLDVHAFRWVDGVMADLGTLGGKASYANAVSSDGSVVVGFSGTGRTSHAFRWTAKDGMQDLGTLGGAKSAASAVSADGRVVVGSSETAEGVEHAFRWTAKSGMQDLGTLGNAGDLSRAKLVSADGRVVVGGSVIDGRFHAFRWTADSRMQLVTDWLAASGVVLPDGAILYDAKGISADGSTLVIEIYPGVGLAHALAVVKSAKDKKSAP